MNPGSPRHGHPDELVPEGLLSLVAMTLMAGQCVGVWLALGHRLGRGALSVLLVVALAIHYLLWRVAWRQCGTGLPPRLVFLGFGVSVVGTLLGVPAAWHWLR